MDRENDIGFLIKLIYDDLGRVLGRRFQATGLTPSQAEVLQFVNARSGARTTLRDVEAFLGVSHPTVVGLVQRLVEKGFLVSLPDPDDGRARNLYPRLPDKLASDNPVAASEIVESERILAAGLSEAEQKELVRMLKIIRSNLLHELE